MNSLYPLKFTPLFKSKIWGGSRISQMKIGDAPVEDCGEAWVLSGLPDDETLVCNGFLANNSLEELIEIYMAELVGEEVFQKFGCRFPLLYKLIHAEDHLSVQVHPEDRVNEQGEELSGKAEMWYILESDKEGEIILGLKEKMRREDFADKVEDHRLLEVLDVKKVSAGDVFYIPPGCIHALKKGVFLAEIQQACDTTYRLWDWDRVDDQGLARELHLSEALDAIRYDAVSDGAVRSQGVLNATTSLLKTPYFFTNEISLNKALEKDYSELDAFVTLMAVKGSGRIVSNGTSVDIRAGEVVLIPAALDKVQIFPDSSLRLIETYIP